MNFTLFEQYNSLDVFLFVAVSLEVIEIFCLVDPSVLGVTPEHNRSSTQLHSDRYNQHTYEY